ncbi:DUF1819 family protein [Rhizobium leguminosarum]|uniref:DUF1819 family protein n=1 Tax=Rhizobium leguminosarum TaxID=384 RepID=UPI00197E7A80|nr:DUF1819 family protein [Rhizobium leguminosarum]
MLYTTQLQAGLGLTTETKTLLELWSPGMSVSQLNNAALHSGRFPTITARRLRNIIAECFAPRYLISSGEPARYLKQIVHSVSGTDLTQLMLVYTGRANPILRDFISDIYWSRYVGGYTEISNEDARAFVERAIDDGKTSKRWSESTIRRVSAYLTGCCADYGLLDRGVRSKRRILPVRISGVFPRDDGDDYLSLCLRAKPDHSTEVRRVFAGSPSGPPFSVIDAIGGGASWPQLRAALKVESGREILTALLSPTTRQAEALKTQEGWSDESREFLSATLGMSVKTRGKTWTAIADELWRFVLFSEFVFDLPVPLPASLQSVPRAPDEARPIIEDVCDGLRNSPGTRNLYIERAEGIEAELDLTSRCSFIEDLGDRDTFPFEERTFLKAAIKGITTNNTDATRRVLARHKNSVWRGKGESHTQWELVRAGLGLVEACDDNERQLSEHVRTQASLLDFYLGSLRDVDRLQREFEQAIGDFLDPHDLMQEVIDQARARYGRLVEKVQSAFVKHLAAAGWPPEGRLANANVFDQFLAGRLKESGRRVAYLMVDALRYELGVALEKMLSEDGPVELQAA